MKFADHYTVLLFISYTESQLFLKIILAAVSLQSSLVSLTEAFGIYCAAGFYCSGYIYCHYLLPLFLAVK